MPAKEQEQAGKEQAKAPFFHVLYIGYHQQKLWPRLKLTLPTSEDLDFK